MSIDLSSWAELLIAYILFNVVILKGAGVALLLF